MKLVSNWELHLSGNKMNLAFFNKYNTQKQNQKEKKQLCKYVQALLPYWRMKLTKNL